MAKKKLYKSRLDLIQEIEDSLVHVVEEDGKKVSDSRNNNLPSNRIKNRLDAPIKEIAPVKTTTKKSSSKKKKKTNVIDKIGYTVKELGAGITSGITGIGTAITSDIADNLRQGNEGDKLGVFGDTLLGILSPATYMAKKSHESFKNNFGDDTKTTKEKIVSHILDTSSSTLEAFSPVENMIKVTGTIAPDTADDKVLKLGEKIQAPSDRLREKLDEEAAEYGTGWQIAGQTGNVVGNMLPSIAATLLTKNPTVGMATMGIGAKGNSTMEAIKKNADLETAVKMGNAKGMVEAGSEMLTGGLNIFGKGALDDIVTRGIDKKVKNEVLNFVAQKGAGIGGEILEETITDVLNTTIDQGTVEPEATYSIDDFGETAVVTMLSTIVLNAITGGYGSSSFKANAERMQENNYSQNEQKVIDSLVEEQSNEILKQRAIENEVNKAITTRETEQGGILSSKEKTALTEAIKAEIEANDIDVSNTKLSNKEISKIRQEVEEKLQKGQLDTSKIDSILGNTITEQDALLGRSYQEQAKKGQNFTYDAEKVTNEQEKAVYESAAKYFNDTTRSHEFVEKVAKISKEKGTNYGFINNEELKSLGHDVEGKQVNGLVRTNKDGKQTVLINIDSPKALNTIVGHETAHLLEGTQEYKDLQEAIFNYAKEKGDFNDRESSLKALYEGIDNADINSELTADLVGDYLFTDEKFIDSLSTQKPTVFQKIKELIDDLVVKFTGTKEEKALREVQKKFKEAYKKNTQSTEGTQYALTQDRMKEIEGTVLNNKDGYEYTIPKELYQGKGKPKNPNSNVVSLAKYGQGEYYTPRRNRAEAYGNVTTYTEIQDKFQNPYIQGTPYNSKMIELLNEYKKSHPDIAGYIDKVINNGFPITQQYMTPQEIANMYIKAGYDSFIGGTDSMPEYLSFGDTKYSLTDNQGRTLTKEQQEYFKDSKVRDSEGRLLEVYNGEPEDFGNTYKFLDKNMQWYKDEPNTFGFFFTNNIETAKGYANTDYDSNGVVKNVYLDIKNPLDLRQLGTRADARTFYTYLENAGIERIKQSRYSKQNNYVWKYFDEEQSVLANQIKNAGYDGVIFEEGNDISYVVFNSNQIKNIDNTNPTSDADIRYSLSEKGTLQDSNGNEVKLETSETGTHGTLMAIHNLSESKLKGILELGGFPVPSIAVMNPSTTDLSYGEISVLFDKSTIDPSNKANEVYGSDVYSPRFPQTVQKVNEKELSKLEKYLNKRLDIEDTTLDETKQKMKYQKAFIDKFIEENNIKVEDVYKDADDNYGFSKNEAMKQFVIKNDINYEKLLNDKTLREEFYRLYREASPVQDWAERKIKIWENAFADNNVNIGNRLDNDFNAIKNGSEKVLDQYSTDLAKRTKVMEEYSELYKKYLNEKLTPVFGNKYIRNNKNLYTPSGNRRSFNQLYNDYNLDNVVKEMKGKVRGEEGFFYGAGNIRSQVTPQFKSIAEIKANESKLITNSEMESIKEDIDSDLNNLSVTAKNFGGYSYDSYETALNEIAGLKKITPAKAKEILSDYGFKNVPDILIDKSIEFLEKLKNAPTEYFEAKPQRAVGLNEVQAIVVPNDIDADLKQQLLDNGLNVIEYDPKFNKDRQRVINQFDDLKFSLSQQGEQAASTGNYNVYGEDVKLEQTIAPLQEEIKTLTETVQELKEQIAPVKEQVAEVEYTQPTKAELDNLMALQETGGTEYANTFFELRDKYGQAKLYKGINEYKKAPDTYESPIKGDEFAPVTEAELPMLEERYRQDFQNLDDSFIPTESEDIAPDTDYEMTTSKSLFETRDYEDVGSRKVNAYQYDNPEVKPYFQEEAKSMLGDLESSIKGERYAIDISQQGYDIDNSNGYVKFGGVERQTTRDIAELLDGLDGKYKLSYDDIRKGLKAIINDEGAENNAASKRIEFYLDQRLREGYTTIDGIEIPANQEYINTIAAKEFNEFYDNVPIDESMIPIDVSNSESISPVKKLDKSTPRITRATEPEPIKGANQLTIDGNEERIISNSTYKEIADILTEEPETQNNRNKRKWALFKANVLDKGAVFEDLSLKERNREIISKWDYTLTSEARGQNTIGQGHYEYDPYTKTTIQTSKSLNDIREQVDNTGLTKEFYEYMYHKHNVDRMTLDKRFGTENKPVFGNVTAEQSQAIVDKYEKNNPEFIEFAQDVYDYVNADKQQLVNSGVISQETADLWSKMYPHYVPTRRTTDVGLDINVPLDTRRTGINAPVKQAIGGSADILPLFDTMAMRTLQTYRATAKNSFGVELMNTLGTKIESNQTSVDEVIDSIDSQEDLLQEGIKGRNPTFTVFENGEKSTFEITKDMYDALKPVSDSSLLSKTIKPLNAINNIRRGLLTEYNPTFILTNPIKDTQDILLNSQHSAKTYAKIPEAHKQLLTKGYWYQEYIANGGDQNSYFDNETNTFKTENKGLAKLLDLPPLSTISKLNKYIETIPRLAEYIASRESGRSIETSMLDAARVTTNFKAGGAVTKFANRNGATFLNASVQGAMQNIRNIREAKANGLKGWVNLATKFVIAGVPGYLLNSLLWDDDEEYEELSDYVKQNYYIVAKDDEGNFIRIPKGRAVAVIQEGINQMENLITGDDEADLKSFIDLVINNLAPNNPLENNIISPIVQVAKNEAWYGGDLVPSRLQNLPVAEQYDESTDKFSRWVGETLNVSPYKVNYLLDQYSGGIGDMLLPMMTPEAKNDAETLGDHLIAPIKDKFTANSTSNNQNVSDFYDLKEELTIKANKSDATDKEILQNKYLYAIGGELSELYEKKREIQNSNLSNSEKYEQANEIQEQINDITRNALSEYTNVLTTNSYAKVGDREYYKYINSNGEEGWAKVKEEEAEDLSNLGLTNSEKSSYFKAKKEISSIETDDKDYQGRKNQIIEIIKDTGFSDEQKAYLYKKYYNTDTVDTIINSGISIDAYFDYSSKEFEADKDNQGNSIPYTRKNKVIKYVNELNLTIPEKAILIKSTNTFKFDTYNNQIVEYVDGLDISYEEKIDILEELDMEVLEDGTVKWGD